MNTPRRGTLVRGIPGAMLACAGLLSADQAVAQPRSEIEISREATLPVTEREAMGEWLRRLAGRFRFDGMVQTGECADIQTGDGTSGPPPPPPDRCRSVSGKSDCIGVGAGPGVQCVLNVEWLEFISINPETGEPTLSLPPYLNPAMELFGVDPGRSAINRLNVNNKGLPEGGLGTIRGNVATFRSPCVNRPVGCYNIVRIEAKPEAKLLYWWLSEQLVPDAEVQFGVMTLRRVTPEEESAPTLKPVR